MCIKCAGLDWIGNHSVPLMYAVYVMYMICAGLVGTLYQIKERCMDFVVPGRATTRELKLQSDLNKVREMIANRKPAVPKRDVVSEMLAIEY